MNTIHAIINGTAVTAPEGTTIRQAVHQNNLDTIPALCHDDRLEHYTSCFLCVVEVEGMNKLLPSCSAKLNEGMVIHTKSAKVTASRKAALSLLMSNHYADCIGPCRNNCPAGVDAQAYIALLDQGKYREALRLIKDNNPLPLSICRVCVRDCEAACRRSFVDEPVAVNSIKRFIADSDAPDKWMPEMPTLKEQKVAIIGAGPAGLTAAYYLRKQGFASTIFEKLPAPGGMLRYGIPEYRLPKQILDDEINWILQFDITLKTNQTLGKDFTIHDLLANGYQAVFVAVGAHKAGKPGIEGEECTEGIIGGIDFLRDFAMTNPPSLHGNVVVVGGGNTAIDAARSARRSGADSVTIVYRRSINEMPAHPEEIAAAQHEGVNILFLTNPKKLITANNKLIGIECLKMTLEQGAPGERPKPRPVPGSETIVPCNILISAIGQNIDTTFTDGDSGLLLDPHGVITVNPENLTTSLPGVFAGGDVVTGPLTAISSIAQGKKAANSIMQYLEHTAIAAAPKPFYSFRHTLSELSEREFAAYKKVPRHKQPALSPDSRVYNFEEVEAGLCESDTLDEMHRCLECGCSEFDNCQLRKYCDEYQIDITRYIGETKKYIPDNRHPFIKLDANKCINCGKCVRTCSEILRVAALGFVYRGFKSVVKPAMEKALAETNCINCGNCIDVCPTGAISEKLPFKSLGSLPKTNHEAICGFCSVGCTVNFMKVDNDIFFASNNTASVNETHNTGFLCSRGRFGHRYMLQKNRVVTPLIRESGETIITSLKNALTYTASRVNGLIKQYGTDAIAVIASPHLSNEELYLLQKLARVTLGNNNIDSFSNILNWEEQYALDDSLGFTASTITYENLNNADIIVLLNTNLTDDNLVMELKVKAARKRGALVIYISSAETGFSRFADIWVDTRKGSNTLFMNAVMQTLIQRGAVDSSFIESRTDGYHEFVQKISAYSVSEALALAGVSDSLCNAVADKLQKPDANIAFIYDINAAHEKSAHDLQAIGNFLLLTGRMGKPDNGIIILREYNNAAGLMAMGAVSHYLPGFITGNNAGGIEALERLWNCNLKNIYHPVDLHGQLANGNIKGLLIFGEDPLLNPENYKYLCNLDFLFVSSAYTNSVSQSAHVLVPALTHAEYTASYTRADNTIQESRMFITPAWPFNNLDSINMLAESLSGLPLYSDMEKLSAEITHATGFHSSGNSKQVWPAGYFSNGFRNKKLKFALYDITLAIHEGPKHTLHYQEDYYQKHLMQELLW